MLPGETIATGAPTICPTCTASVLPLVVLHAGDGYYIGTRCDGTSSYSRESDYDPTRSLAEADLADHSFGRGGIVARDVPAYWPEEPVGRAVVTERSFASGMRKVRERKACFIAQITGMPAADVVEGIDAVLSYAAISALWTRRFSVTVLHKIGPWRFRRYLPGDPLARVFDLTVEATNAKTAANIVLAITNSYPDALRCYTLYAAEVAAYRVAGCRSLLVGDVVLIGDAAGDQTAWACGWAALVPLSALPAYRTIFWSPSMRLT